MSLLFSSFNGDMRQGPPEMVPCFHCQALVLTYVAGEQLLEMITQSAVATKGAVSLVASREQFL